MAPLVRRTWALVGKTPILYQRGRSYQKVSMIAALSVPPTRARIGLYFSIYNGKNINSISAASFLKRLMRHLQKPLIVVWDRGSIHRGGPVKNYVNAHRTLHLEFFPAYAPELNPVEPFWGYLKHNSLANFAPVDIDSLSYAARYQSNRIRERGSILRSFLYSTPLYSCPK